MDTDIRDLNEITKTIIGCAFRVFNKLGAGFLEKVYLNAMYFELRKAGLDVRQSVPITVQYEGVIVGEYIADLMVGEIIIELKAVEAFTKFHFAQCLKYLKATGKSICLLFNFGSQSVQIKRFRGRGYSELGFAEAT